MVPYSRYTFFGLFQSTLPAWGETATTTNIDTLLDISIHSPRMGRDVQMVKGAAHDLLFQSTLPAWGETTLPAHPPHSIPISIHSPRMGRDPARLRPSVLVDSNFNPLSPHGERRDAQPLKPSAAAFQSTLPAWGETRSILCFAVGQIISIHSPRMGRDPAADQLPGAEIISIHSPRMGRDERAAV